MKRSAFYNYSSQKAAIMLLAMLLFVASVSSCTTTSHATFSHPNDNNIGIYMTKLPVEPYQEVAFIEVFGSIFATKQRLLHRLKLRAEELGCDAVVNVAYKNEFIYPIITGTAVKTK